MSQSVQYDKGTGMFSVQVLNADGTTTTQSVNFASLCMMYSLEALGAQDENFATQFEMAQQQVNQMTEINNCTQMFNKYSDDINDDENKSVTLHGVVDSSGISEADAQKKIDEHNNNLNDTDVAWGYTVVDDKAYIYEEGSDYGMWMSTYYPDLVESGLVGDSGDTDKTQGIGVDGKFDKEEFDSIMDNLSSALSTSSSQNEQQMLLTNDAANKRSSVLQQAQTLLQAAMEARKASAQTV